MWHVVQHLCFSWFLQLFGKPCLIYMTDYHWTIAAFYLPRSDIQLECLSFRTPWLSQWRIESTSRYAIWVSWREKTWCHGELWSCRSAMVVIAIEFFCCGFPQHCFPSPQTAVKPPGHLAPEGRRKNYQKAKARISSRDASNLDFSWQHPRFGMDCMSFGKGPNNPTHFVNKRIITGNWMQQPMQISE